MGQVHRATDTKLKRQVAIKILPPSLAVDADRLTRFQREAEVLASLNHPHIAAIYGLEESSGITALVMELVEGDDLSQRIARGPIPIEEAVPIARQIAEALEAAHEQGIVHRDLKPANIKVRTDGTVKVLDFGLAKAMEQGSGIGNQESANAANSPTITTPAMTMRGTILGTAAYMAPEQAKGRALDKRVDIWAFGVVLYEMLSGRRLFAAEDVSETLAAVLTRDVSLASLPDAVPARLRVLLRHCLVRDPRQRLRDIGDARIILEQIIAGAPDVVSTTATVIPAWRRALPWAAVGALTAGLATVLALWPPWRNTTAPRVPISLSAELGADVPIGGELILSPDGAVLAFVGRTALGGNLLYTRRLNQLKATPLSGTDGANGPFFSPDGQWIAFFSGGQLKKIPAGGGAAIPLCDAPSPRGGAWSEDGTIVFQPDTRAVPNALLVRVSSDGGEPKPLTPLADGEVTQRSPDVLPGGRAVLFTSSRVIGAFDDADVVVLTLSTGARKVVQRGGYHGRYLRSGHLVYIHEGILFAAPFDLDRLEVTAQPVPVLEGITSATLTAAAQFATSDSGTFVYLPGPSNGSSGPIHWIDRAGTTAPLRAKPANWANVRFAPDGRRLAVEIIDAQNDVWIYEWARDVLTRLTSDPAMDTNPVWTPDGTRIVFASTRANSAVPNLYWQRADGTGDTQRLTESNKRQWPVSWHPDGKLLAYDEFDEQGRADRMILPMTGDDQQGWKPGKPTAILPAQSFSREPTFSPDGRWLAYTSNATGRDEVYVQPFPGPGVRTQVSTSGGQLPTWSRTRSELLYSEVGQIMISPFSNHDGRFQAETPRMWPEGHSTQRGPWRMFDLHPDGERLALQPAVSRAPQSHVTFIFNFFEELRRIAPAKK